MALTATVSSSTVMGNRRKVSGTFTTAIGDSTGTITTGLDFVEDYEISLSEGGIDTPVIKTSESSGTITVTANDFHGYSGRFWAIGI